MSNELVFHKLKTWPKYFNAVEVGVKKFELRKDDRGFKKGDYLILQEYEPITKLLTDFEILARVDYVLRGEEAEEFGVKPGYCILSITKLAAYKGPVHEEKHRRWIRERGDWI